MAPGIRVAGVLMRFVAPKGSICVNGVSLTVNNSRRTALRRQHHSAHACQVTTLGELQIDDGVNIEIDVIAR
jgi:riboflavin synthase